jgi:hypothetical protein
MEKSGDNLAAAVRDLLASMTASMRSLRASVEDSKSILWEVVVWRPQVDTALQDMRGNLNTLRQQLGRVALNPILGVDPATLRATGASTLALPGEIPLSGFSDGGRGPVGHGVHPQQWRVSEGDPTLTAPPAMGTCSDSDLRMYQGDGLGFWIPCSVS